MVDMSIIKLDHKEISQLQDKACDLLNFNLNYSPAVPPLFSRNICRRSLVKATWKKLQSALSLIKENEFLLDIFDSFRISMESRTTTNSLLYFFHGLSDLINLQKIQLGLISEEILLLNVRPFSASELKHANPENVCLENIATLFRANSDLFKIAFFNGSLGSNDYVPGWSDVDIFAVISTHAFSSQENFARLTCLARQIKKEIYSYNRLQIHSVFYSLETDLHFHRYNRLPTVCLKNGRILVNHESKLVLHKSEAVQSRDALGTYRNFFNDFIRVKKLRNKGILTKVFLIHRLFLFPLLFLATKGVKCYKADSFDLLPEYLSALPDVPAFCNTLKDIYISMDIKYSKNFYLRRLFMNVIDPLYVNKLSLFSLNSQTASINSLFDSISAKGLFDQAEKYWLTGLD